MTAYDEVLEAVAAVRHRCPGVPEVAVVLGSGLGAFASRVGDACTIPYAELPHWPRPTVPGHTGRLVLGRLGVRRVAVLAGRIHLYEAGDPAAVGFGVRVMGVLGAHVVILTNAAGGVDPALGEGTLMLIDDHLNLTGMNPLVGLTDDRFGERFPDMGTVYSARLRGLAETVGAAQGLRLARGVYAGVLGPSYETPAEIRWLRAAGAHAVGMSTVNEAIAARQMDLELLGISCITNRAAGVATGAIAHADVLAATHRAGDAIAGLLEGVIERL